MQSIDSPIPHFLIRHEAMMTEFSLRILTDDIKLAQSLETECIERIDELERKLSRYHEGGEIYQINRLQAGQTLRLSEECYDCLLLAMEASVDTAGLFDITLGRQIEHLKSELSGDSPAITGQLALSPDQHAIDCLSAGRVLDLGGIGKGFTLDQIRLILQSWEIKGGLLSAGASTHLAFGCASWPINLTGEHHSRTLQLENASLSASGDEVQGGHILHPQLAEVPAQHKRIWSQCELASHADAWSTALFLTPEEMIGDSVKSSQFLQKVYVENQVEITAVS
ncbi:FAD:protein FMN transferase [Persicirhabdus sediminis]|uniref:FAD:protein FMN transferase n=1 Tax=Persicirhabdus sediminis TaxID=454144 RepID=A0A8J7MI65_9BACT|nr:FAD:protein FMN transferase [Persicirhabdus sediminis]MBK1792439.1 FAD:protein FMN transferase [Persicirhabdus sediminis]